MIRPRAPASWASGEVLGLAPGVDGELVFANGTFLVKDGRRALGEVSGRRGEVGGRERRGDGDF